MSKFFKGLAASATWVCFDEFNRLEIQVLSVISQLIILIQRAKCDLSERIVIEDSRLAFRQDCALFITMNPYVMGRTPLPDNLKALFRQITMVIPDTVFIAEILLYSMGFRDAQGLARKLTHTFKLISEQLSGYSHYDFGLRTIKMVLLNAGNLKLRALNVDTAEKLKLETAAARLQDHVRSLQRARTKKRYHFSDQAKVKRKKMLDKMKEELEIKRQMDEEESDVSPARTPNTPLSPGTPGL